MKKSPMRNKIRRPVVHIRSKSQIMAFRAMVREYYEDREAAARAAQSQLFEDMYNYFLRITG